MPQGPVSYFPASIASGISITGVINLGKSWSRLSAVLPTMVSGANINFLGSETSDGTFRPLYQSASVASACVILSSVSNCIVPLPNIAVQYMKIQLTSSTTDNAYTFSIIASD